jgi:hypothetical protein
MGVVTAPRRYPGRRARTHTPTGTVRAEG